MFQVHRIVEETNWRGPCLQKAHGGQGDTITQQTHINQVMGDYRSTRKDRGRPAGERTRSGRQKRPFGAVTGQVSQAERTRKAKALEVGSVRLQVWLESSEGWNLGGRGRGYLPHMRSHWRAPAGGAWAGGRDTQPQPWCPPCFLPNAPNMFLPLRLCAHFPPLGKLWSQRTPWLIHPSFGSGLPHLSVSKRPSLTTQSIKVHPVPRASCPHPTVFVSIALSSHTAYIR